MATDANAPESRYEPSDVLVPETPDGYDPPTELRYPMPVLLAGTAALLVLGYLAYSSVLWALQGDAIVEAVATVEPTADGEAIVVDLGLVFGVFLSAVLVTTVVHELLHGLAFRYYGYDVSYGVAPHMGAFYAAAFHQFVTREHIVPVALAPLVVITVVCLPLLAVPVPLVALWFFFVLLFNTAGAVGDLYITARALRMPAATLLYDSDIRHSYVFSPSESA